MTCINDCTFCIHQHEELKEGWIPCCDAYPDGIPFGLDKAKIDLKIREKVNKNPDGKLVLVTAITPTKAGEGKTTTSIGLTDGMNKIGVPSLLCLREPSLGPVFGLKGGATGGGKASVTP